MARAKKKPTQTAKKWFPKDELFENNFHFDVEKVKSNNPRPVKKPSNIKKIGIMGQTILLEKGKEVPEATAKLFINDKLLDEAKREEIKLNSQLKKDLIDQYEYDEMIKVVKDKIKQANYSLHFYLEQR